MTQDTIHEVVRNRYGAIARSQADPDLQVVSCCSSPSGSSCCESSSCSDSSGLYDPAMLEGLPVDVTNLSLGCGDPVTIATIEPGETVVDLGSGAGMDCFLAAKRVGKTGKVIGVDMTPEMIAKAEANKAKMGISNVEFRLGQIEAMPVADNSVDVIMSNCVINLSPDKAAVFREAFRVLKPGGRVAVSDIVTEGEFSPEMRTQVDKWAECVTGAIDTEVYIGFMRQAGFTDIQVVDKVSAEPIVTREEGMPRIFSARITGRKA